MEHNVCFWNRLLVTESPKIQFKVDRDEYKTVLFFELGGYLMPE